MAEAAKDLFNPARAGEGISVFRVDEPEATTAAILFSLTCKETPGEVDYILLPEDALEGERLAPAPDLTLVPFLAEKHWEIGGMNEEKSRMLAKVLLAKQPPVVRLSEKTILEGAAAWREDPEVTRRLRDRWRRRLKW